MFIKDKVSTVTLFLINLIKHDILNNKVPQFLTLFKLKRIEKDSDINKDILLKKYKSENKIIGIYYNFEHELKKNYENITVDDCNIIFRLMQISDILLTDILIRTYFIYKEQRKFI